VNTTILLYVKKSATRGYRRGSLLGRAGALFQVGVHVGEDLGGHKEDQYRTGRGHDRAHEGAQQYGEVHHYYARVGPGHAVAGAGVAVFAGAEVVHKERGGVAGEERQYAPLHVPKIMQPEVGAHRVHGGLAQVHALQHKAEQEDAVHEHEHAEMEGKEAGNEHLCAHGQRGVRPAGDGVRPGVFRGGVSAAELCYGAAGREYFEQGKEPYYGRLAPVERQYFVKGPGAAHGHSQPAPVGGY